MVGEERRCSFSGSGLCRFCTQQPSIRDHGDPAGDAADHSCSQFLCVCVFMVMWRTHSEHLLLFVYHFHTESSSRSHLHFCPKQRSVIHTLMAVAAMQGADQHIRSSLGFSILPKDTLSCRQTRGMEPATFRSQDTGSTPEPQPPVTCRSVPQI